MKKTSLTVMCITVFILGLIVVSCQKKEEPAVKVGGIDEKAAGYGEKAKEAVAGYGDKEKEAVAGYGDKPKEATAGYGDKAK
jgi:hypothetical protein